MPGALAHFRLGELAERKHELGEKLPRKAPEEVRLILVMIDTAHQNGVARFVDRHARIMPCRDVVAAEKGTSLQQVAKLRVAVATHAWVRCATRGILCHEVVDDVAVELFLY